MTTMRILTTIILISTWFGLHGQELDFKKDFETISKAISASDAKAISYFAPREQFGPVDYIAPKANADRVLMTEFAKRLEKFFMDYPPTEFVLLDTRQTDMSLPLAVGRYVTKNDKKYFILMLFAIYEDKHGFLTFHVVDKLPSSM